MTEIRIQKFTLIRLIYGIILIIFLISAFLPYYSISYVYPPPPAAPIWSYSKDYMGYIELLYGGWPGFALIVFSVMILSPDRKRNPLIFGGIGCILIIINLTIRPSLQAIVFNSGFYVGLIFGIGLIIVNISAFICKEGVLTFERARSDKIKEVKVKSVKVRPDEVKPVEIEPIEFKQNQVVGIDWETKEYIEEKTVDFIKAMQFKLKELPFYEIISKTGIKRETLETVVDDMISNKEIDARIRDFVIIFKPISREKREEGLKKITKGLEQKLLEIEVLIRVNRFDEALSNLNEIIETAEDFELTELLNKAKEDIDRYNKLKIEKSKELEEQRVKEELRSQISEIESLIEENNFKIAYRNLEKVKQIAKEYNLSEFLKQVEELTNQCNTLELEIKRYIEESKIKKTIQQKMLTANKLIDQKKFDTAIENLEQAIEDAKMYDLKDFTKEAEEKIKLYKKLKIEWRKEQKQNIKENLTKRMSAISVLIKKGKIKNALKQLDKVKEIAQEYEILEFLNEANEKINECKTLKFEIRKDKEQMKIEKKLQKKLFNIEKLIESNKFYDAIINLVDTKEIARQYELSELLDKIESKIDYCKDFQFNIKKKIKKTILNYGSKLARLELMDISEKSGIQDENLIEQIILEMIKNREISAEYFSSSKSIAFYQQTKEIAPMLPTEEISKQRIFLSYSTLDAEYFRISDIVKDLEVYPEIKRVSYWQADSKQNIVEFMENTLKNTDVFVLFCSKNSNKSDAVRDEWQAAFQMRKKGMLKIIPVYEDEDDIPVLLWQMLNVKFTKDNFDGFIEKLYKEILRGLEKKASPVI